MAFTDKINMNRKLQIQIGIGLAAMMIILAIFLLIRHKRNHIHDLPSIMESGRLTVLTDSSSLGFSKKGDNIYGFQYEIIKAFADSLGLELVITEESDTKACMAGLKSEDYDILASFIPVTAEWKNEVLFTNSLFTSRQVLVQRIINDTTQTKVIKNQFQLANDTIYLPVNSPYKMRIEHLAREIADTIHIIEMKNLSSEQLVHLVAMGKIKYAICNEQFSQPLKFKYPNLDFSVPIGFEQKHSWVVHKESTQLLDKLNEFLDDFIGSSDYWTIYRKYYN
jgi:membrane-bound lytic murein transglycosylase F